MSTPPKGHHGYAGVIGVFLEADDVWILHQWAEANELTDQIAAGMLLRGVLRNIEAGTMTAGVVRNGAGAGEAEEPDS